MRILVVQESDWFEKGPHQSHHLMERLSLRGHEIRVIDFEILWKNHDKKSLMNRREVVDEFRKATPNGRVSVVRPSTINMPILDYVSLAFTHHREIHRQMKEYEPDVVVGLGILNASIAIRQAKKNGVPFVYYVIDELHRLVAQPMLRYLARFIEKSNMTKSDLVLSINEALRDYTLAMGAVEERTMIVGAGIDVQRFAVNRNRSAIRIHHGIEDGDTLLFFMGWLYDFSGLKELALELAENDPTYRRMKLLILGKGEALDEIREIQKHYGLGNRIVIVQWVPYEQVPDYLSASDICILPSLKHKIMENIVPIKIYEYMAAGKPVIATKSLGLLKEFGKDNGILYVEEPGDVLKEALKMVENGNTCMLGMKGKRYVESRDWEVVTQKFEEILRGLS